MRTLGDGRGGVRVNMSGAAARTGSLIKKDKETIQKRARRRFLLIKKHNKGKKVEQINRIAGKRQKTNKRSTLKEVLTLEKYMYWQEVLRIWKQRPDELIQCIHSMSGAAARTGNFKEDSVL